LTALIRVALGRSIVQQIFGRETELPVIALEQNLEKLLMQAINSGRDGGIEPGLAASLLKQCEAAARKQEVLGWPAVLLVPAVLRPLLAHFLGRTVAMLKVLSHAEIPEGKVIKVTSNIGAAV
ncbi:MAG: FHIPEP family type III secretion protein, partial [Thiobacillaceae bacterium]